jgi:uncharacterized protein
MAHRSKELGPVGHPPIRLRPTSSTTKETEMNLTISVCPRCGSRWFPTRDICSACAHSGLDEHRTGDRGVAYASTVVRIAPAGFTAPYVLSYIDIDGVRILAHTDAADALTPDTPVVLTSGPIGNDGQVSHRVREARR